MGRLIVLCGLDAAGKASQSKILAERLHAELYSFPRYNTPIGQIIRKHLQNEVRLARPNFDFCDDAERVPEDPLMFQCLNLADKVHAAGQILTSLAAGHVVCDRWIPSAICYGAADGIDRDWLWDAHRVLPQADLNIFLDITPEEALRRRPDARDRYERDREKQQRVRVEYQQLWAGGGRNYVTVNGDGGGSGDGPIAVVAERIWAAVQEHTKKGLM